MKKSKMAQDFLSINDLAVEQIQAILALAHHQKAEGVSKKILDGKHLAMIFEKPSLRTRVSFEVGIKNLGGNSLYYDMQNEALGERETLKDVALNLSQYLDGLIIRNHDHAALKTIADYAGIPVINALCNMHHPCQALADWLTLEENHKNVSELHMAYVGDGNNVCHSLMQIAAHLGPNLSIVTPEHHAPAPEIVQSISKTAERNHIEISLSHDLSSLKNVDVIYTDSWLSMGDTEKQKEKAFEGFQVNTRLMTKLNAKWFLHCQPMHRGKEVSDAVADSMHSLVYHQSANRMHAQNALLTWLYQSC